MARYGLWRPLAANWAAQPKLTAPRLVVLHTMVGSLQGTDGYFRRDGYGGAESHWGVGHEGAVWQWQDTAHRAEANGAANAYALSVETADVGTGFPKWNTNDGGAVPEWTPAQREAIAGILAWAHRTHGIPLELIPDSKPGRRGIGYHRQGVVTRKGATTSQTGGDVWSSAPGKVCPGARRIAQIPGIIARARVLAGQVALPAPVVNPSRPPAVDTPRRDEPVLENYVRALTDPAQFTVTCPVAANSGLLDQAWLSFVATNAPVPVDVWFQTDRGGWSEAHFTAEFAKGHGPRVVLDWPKEATRAVIRHGIPNVQAGLTVTLEAKAR